MQKKKLPHFFSNPWVRKIIHYRAFAPFIALIGLFVGFNLLTDSRFLSQLSINSILSTAPEFGILAIGVTFLMVAGELDLSVGAVFTFCTFMYANLLLNLHVNPILAILTVLALGAAIGTLNGVISFTFQIPTIIVTLGTMYFWRGLTLVLTGGLPISFRGEQRNLVPFKEIFVGKIFGVPEQIIWFLFLSLIFEIFLYRHRFGNLTMAVGGSQTVAKEMGISVRKVKVLCFALTGLLVAFSAILQMSRIYEGSARLGVGYEFYAIAATVVGGTALTGGSGTVMGTFFGALILQSIGIGLAVMRMPGYWINVFLGIVIILVMVLNTIVARRRR